MLRKTWKIPDAYWKDKGLKLKKTKKHNNNNLKTKKTLTWKNRKEVQISVKSVQMGVRWKVELKKEKTSNWSNNKKTKTSLITFTCKLFTCTAAVLKSAKSGNPAKSFATATFRASNLIEMTRCLTYHKFGINSSIPTKWRSSKSKNKKQ